MPTSKNLKGRYVKANALVNAAYRLTVAEQRVLIMALMNANARTISDQVLYRVKASDLMRYTSTTLETTLEILKAAVDRLAHRHVMFYETPEGQPCQLVRASWVQTIRYEDATASVLLRFNYDILPYINRLTKRFTIVYMDAGDQYNMMDLNSNFSYRLLEMMSQWVDRGWFDVTPETIRRNFALTTQYKQTRELKRRVLDVAVSEINLKTPWHVNYESIKRGRTIIAFKFKFTPPETVKKSRQLQKLQQKQKIEVDDADIQKHARPGESYASAKERLIRSKQEINQLKSELVS